MPASRPEQNDDRSSLMLAACGGDLCEVFDLLLSGVDLDQQDSRKWTALMYACWSQQYEIVQQLLDSGAEPNIHQSYDMVETPLSIAAENGSFEIVRLLIAHNADPNCCAGIAAARAESYARRAGHHDISEFLLYHEDRRPIQKDLQ
jgi:ankyrin repeat protein